MCSPCAFPNLYRHYSGNNDEENNSLPSTEEAPDEPPPVIGELGCDLVTSQDGHILRPEMNFLELRHRFNTKATSAGDQVGGTDVWYIDTPPNSECPVHRTIGLDFLVQIMGKMEFYQVAQSKQESMGSDDGIYAYGSFYWEEDPPSRAGFPKQ
ncbi:hypothetical protein HAV15_012203 [Penicillium sp. str. |nr:hypothetical protein HAV15_012203 [Penicillium sp. str. \